MIYAQLLTRTDQGNGLAAPQSVTGLPAVSQAEVGADWFGYKCTYAVQIGAAAIAANFEPSNYPLIVPGFGAKPIGLALAKQLRDHAAEARAACEEARRLAPGVPIILYANPPWSDADNIQFAASGLYDSADAMAVNVYLDASERSYNATQVSIKVKQQIKLAQRFAKPIVVYLSPVYMSGGGDVPTSLIKAQIKAAAGYDVCLWADGVDEAGAKRYAGVGK